ncbi:hypothetical protein [Janthinobacterium sp. RT4P48]|uniref:hypothetical protein n=1 Tax=Janthinobacterium sp. RT4P48 TaxID=3424188 RepID=UPI003F1F4E46
MTSLLQAWPAIRASLQTASFSEIKEITGLAGLDITQLAHLDQKPEKGATKGQLTTAIDGIFGRMSLVDQSRFLSIVAEEILRRNPATKETLVENLSRLGWVFIDKALIPIRVFDPSDLVELPNATRQDLVKAAQRFRDGDLSGAISAACGAVDAATSFVYQTAQLGDPAGASFQERCKRALSARGVVPALAEQLGALGWSEAETLPFKKNFEGSLIQGAYVLQSLRSRMGDVHGTKPILKPLVFDSLKWAELLVRSLSE